MMELWNVGREERIAILPDTPGHSYILGSEYRRRNVGLNTEFIPVVGVDPIHCLIRVNEEGEFLVDVSVNLPNDGRMNKSKTLVNGKAVQKIKGINVGDTLTMRKVVCRFQERKYRPDDKDDETPIEKTVSLLKACLPPALSEQPKSLFDGILKRRAKPQPKKVVVPALPEGVQLPWDMEMTAGVLPGVFQLLSVSDLKRCRLVSKSWRDEATPILQERSKVCFNFTEDKKHFDAVQIFRYTVEMKEWKPQGLEILLPIMFDLKKLKKIDDDWNRYKTIFGNLLTDVKTLVVGPIYLVPQEENQKEPIWMSIWRMLAPSLEKLDITGGGVQTYGPPGFSPRFPDFLVSSGFPKLKVFVAPPESYGADARMTPWIKELAKAVHNIESVNFKCFLDSIIVLTTFSPQPFPNLAAVDIQIDSKLSSVALEVWVNKVDTPLKKICVNARAAANFVHALKHLSAFIKKHAKTLETLELEIGEPFSVQEDPHYGDTMVTFNWPGPLPNLKKLDLDIHEDIEVDFDETKVKASLIELFPKLQILRFKNSKSECIGDPEFSDYDEFDDAIVSEILDDWDIPVMKALLLSDSDSNEVFPSLRELDIPHAAEGLADSEEVDEEISMEYKERAKKIAMMFPNVKNAWLEEARTLE